jgi:hypothetical protein
MRSEPVRAGADWLRLREPADAGARSRELVARARSGLAPAGRIVIHDLGCGSGSMARWLSGRLPGPQHWVMYDRDVELLALAAAEPPVAACDGSPVSMQTLPADITLLEPGELAGADLITASALLDMMTAPELERLVAICVDAGCPVLIALSVTGHVELAPADPFDRRVAEAFNAHQRRDIGAGALLGPDAAGYAVECFNGKGSQVLVRQSPWRLGPAEAALATRWFTGWLAAACEQRPELQADAAPYARRRLAQAAAGRLLVTVQHQDLLARRP